MLKRILRVIVFALFVIPVFLSFVTVPFMALYVLVKYIITGDEDEDAYFSVVEWVLAKPYRITDEWK